MSERKVAKGVSFTEKMVERVEKAAEQDRRSFSNMVEVLCERALQSMEPTSAPTSATASE